MRKAEAFIYAVKVPIIYKYKQSFSNSAFRSKINKAVNHETDTYKILVTGNCLSKSQCALTVLFFFFIATGGSSRGLAPAPFYLDINCQKTLVRYPFLETFIEATFGKCRSSSDCSICKTLDIRGRKL